MYHFLFLVDSFLLLCILCPSDLLPNPCRFDNRILIIFFFFLEWIPIFCVIVLIIFWGNFIQGVNQQQDKHWEVLQQLIQQMMIPKPNLFSSQSNITYLHIHEPFD